MATYRDRPTVGEEIARAERSVLAFEAARQEAELGRKDSTQAIYRYDTHPATGGGKGLITDILTETAGCTRRFPGLGPAASMGLLTPIVQQATEIIQDLAHRIQERLEAIPREERSDRVVALVFGAPGSGKTTLIQQLLALPELAMAQEDVGGDTQGLLKKAARYIRMGFRVAFFAPLVPLEVAASRAARRTFTNHRPVCPSFLGSAYLEAMRAVPELLAAISDPTQVYFGRAELALVDNRGPLGQLPPPRMVGTLADLHGYTRELDELAREGAMGLTGPMAVSVVVDTTISTLQAWESSGLLLVPDLVWTYAADLEARGKDPRGELLWELWRMSLGAGRGHSGDGSDFPRSAVAELAAEDDAEALDELHVQLKELARRGVEAKGIVAILRARARRDAGLAVLEAVLDEAKGFPSEQVLKAGLRSLRRTLGTP